MKDDTEDLQKKDEIISIRMSKNRKEEFEKKAKELDIPLATYIRSLAYQKIKELE